MSRSGVLHALLTMALTGFAVAAIAVAEAEPVDLTEEESPAVGGRVARSVFTTGIVDREPVDAVTTLSNDRDQVVYFTELLGFEGRTVVHRWEHGDEVMAEVSFQVGGPRWRVHSSKRLDPSWVGPWSVSVVADGEVLTREEFEYTPALAAEAEAPEAPPADQPEE